MSDSSPKTGPADCLTCGSSNDGNFCSNCGNSFLPPSLETLVQREVEKRFSRSSKETHLLEIELAEAVATKLMSWAKLFGYAIAAPVFLFLLILGLFGFERVSDINKAISNFERDVSPKVVKAVTDAEEASLKSHQAVGAIDSVNNQVKRELKSAEGVSANITALTNRISRSEGETTRQVATANAKIEGQLNDLSSKVDQANGEIADQQKKLIDTGELVKSFYSNLRSQFFDFTSFSADHLFREGSVGQPRRVVLMLLKDAPIPESVQIQFHVFSQPRNSFLVIGNLIVFFWGDSAENLKQHSLNVSYAKDPNFKGKLFQTLSVDEHGVIHADETVLPAF